MKRIIAFVLALALTLTLFCGMVLQDAGAEVLMGIDVSEWQGNIDWNKVKAAGVDFAILRGWCYGKDSKFEQNYAGAKAAGIPVGVYCYTYGLTESAITAEMNSLITNCLAGKQFEFPIYVDMECTSYQGNSGWVNGYDINSKSYNATLMATACNVLENAGYFAGMYTYTSFIESYLDVSTLKDRYTMWIADYRATCGYTGPYDMWQYSATGTVNGIAGQVDMNYGYKDFEPIMHSVGLNGFEPGVTYPYVTDDGQTMIYDGEYTYSISRAFGTTFTTVAEHTQGTKSLKMTCPTPNAYASSSMVGGMLHHQLSKSTNLADCDTIAFDLYLTRKMTGSHGFQINLNTSGEDGYNKLIALDNKEAGWLHFEIKKTDFTKAVDNADWSNINRVRLTWFNYAGDTQSTDFYIDNLRAYKKSTPLPPPEPQPDPDVERMIEIIDKLPAPGEVGHHHHDQIQSAREEFNNLSGTQRADVTNSQKLREVLSAYEALPPQLTATYGDVDLNELVTATDALEVLKSVVGKIRLNQQQTLNADVDGNATVSAADALLILQMVVGKISLFPVQQ
ncbi:MAG: hypothetical protein IJP35_04530 [Clostridia bacterium]|nr:hypothetical protein [Clostridia bacterium]